VTDLFEVVHMHTIYVSKLQVITKQLIGHFLMTC